jgi:hypothetical protein
MTVANPNPPSPSIPPVGVMPSDPSNFQSSTLLAIKSRVTPESIAILRSWVQDLPGKRELLDEQSGPTEYSDEECALALLIAADTMNSVPPPIMRVEAGRGAPLSFVLGFASIALLEMSLPRRLANELAFSDSNVAVDDTKFEKAMGYLDRLNQRQMALWMRFKKSANLSNVRGFVPSGYMMLDFLVTT